jgi:hypothetical protein
MAKTFDRFEPAARMAQQYAQLLREVRRVGRELTEYHLQNDFSDAGTEPLPAYVQTDSAGHIRGLNYSPANYGNTVNLAIQVERLLTNQSATSANYVAIIEQVIKL